MKTLNVTPYLESINVNLFLCLSLTFFLISCSSSGRQDYLSIQDNNQKTYKNVSEAVKSSPKKKLGIGTSPRIKIRVTDPAFYNGSVVSNFQAFEIEGLKKGTYGIAASSVCYECLGFRKKVLYPQIHIFDKSYKNITPATTEEFHGFATMAVKKGNLNVEKSGKHYVVISADNSRLAGVDNALDAGQSDNVTLPIPYPISASPEGNVFFSIVEAR